MSEETSSKTRMPGKILNMKYTLRKKFKFEAAHKLPNHDGKCRQLHGHSWVGWVEVCGWELKDEGPKQGMICDYGDIKKLLKPIVEDYLDHHYLNDTLPMNSPTSEEVARWVFRQLRGKIVGLVAVEIEETCTSSCRYEEKAGKTLMEVFEEDKK